MQPAIGASNTLCVGRNESESLNKLCASRPYLMHYLGMAVSLVLSLLPLPAALENVFSSTNEMVIGAVRVTSGWSVFYFQKCC